MLENKKTSAGIHYSRYIVSYRHACRMMDRDFYLGDFEKWLKKEGLNDDEVHHILEIHMMGKMELEKSASKYLWELDNK